ncbi:MAG: alcohol dehydrogenase [Deltaproteobacteria bacterium CG12_big_fil_rev_8_21_14_0_65_43_10]|nr:MAG: alcohol dehydrogenase [Deltaproteobacteria bacterium CG12_big_fil_rev_8_21_14_0_65_43_10]
MAGKLKLVECQKPERGRGEAIIRVLMAGICNTDLEIIKGYRKFKGILGHEFVGVVEECKNHGLLGKRVAGEINCVCGKCSFCTAGLKTHCKDRRVLGILDHHGAFAEYLVLPEENLHLISDKIADEEAVFLEPLAAGFQVTEQVHIMPSDRVIVLGDGKLGLLVAQVLALTGCDLMVAGNHPSKLSIVKSMGIDTSLIDDLGERNADVVIDCTGTPEGLEMAIGLTRPRGTIVLKSTVAENRELDLTPLVVNEITLIGSRCGHFPSAIRALERGLIDVTPLVSGMYSINDGINAFEDAAKKGALKILLTMDQKNLKKERLR